MKLPKSAVIYTEQAPPPVVFQYECRFCRFFMPPNQCAIVEGEIRPTAWCIMYFPLPTELPFLWLARKASEKKI